MKSAISRRFLPSVLPRLWQLERRAGTGSWGSLAPALLGLGASLAEGATMALLVPVVRSLVERDLELVSRLPVIGALVRGLPEAFSRDSNLLVLLVSATLLAALAKVALQYGAELLASRRAWRAAAGLRARIHERLLGFGKLYFDRRSPGWLHQVPTSHVDAIAQALRMWPRALYSACTLGVYLVLMMLLSWRLSLVVAIVLPVLSVCLQRLIARIERSSQVYRDHFAELGKRLTNSLHGIPLIKASASEAAEQRRFLETSGRVSALQYSIDKKTFLVGPLQEIILLGFVLVLVCAIAILDRDGSSADVATLAVFLVLLRRAFAQFGALNGHLAAIAGSAGPLADIEDIFDDAGKHAVPDGRIEFTGLQREIRLHGLGFTYPDGATALRGLDATIERGKVVAIVGASGAGKSTLVHLLLRFYDPPPGAILVDGVDLRELTLESWRSAVALVGQEAYLFDASLRDNLVYGLRRAVADEELEAVLRLARLDELVASLPARLDTEVGDHGVRLSGGERQRVSIARALLKDADILILDEATSAVDAKTERLIREAMADLLRDRTAVVIAHRLSAIRDVDKVLVLERGRIVEEGSVPQLLAARGPFYEHWREQEGGTSGS